MYYTIYKITHNKSGKYYIGKHQTGDLNDSYFGSGKHLRRAIKKYGISQFIKEILFVFDNETEMNAKERELITEDFCSRKDNYNIGIGGEGGSHFKNKKHTAQTKKLISEKRKDYKMSAQTRKLISKKLKDHTVSDDTKLKISNTEKLRWTKKRRKELSEAKKKYYEEHPEVRLKIAKSVRKYRRIEKKSISSDS